MTDRRLGLIVIGGLVILVIAAVLSNQDNYKSNPVPYSGHKTQANAHQAAATPAPSPSQSVAPPAPPSPQEKAKQLREQKERARFLRKMQIQARKEFAKRLEFLNLDKLSLDTHVVARGKNADILIIQGALLGRVLDYKFMKSGLYQSAAKMGFKKVRFINTIDHSWYEWKID